MKHIPLTMLRGHLREIPAYTCPDGFALRTYRPGDAAHWARIETLAGEFSAEERALRRFEADYGAALADLEDRLFFLLNEQGEPIGTATAWYGHFAGEERGRVGWVGIVPAYQGRKLARPLLSAVLERLAASHRTAYLTTQTTSFQAVNMYLNFGFVPYLTGEESIEGWQLMEATLGRSILPLAANLRPST